MLDIRKWLFETRHKPTPISEAISALRGRLEDMVSAGEADIHEVEVPNTCRKRIWLGKDRGFEEQEVEPRDFPAKRFSADLGEVRVELTQLLHHPQDQYGSCTHVGDFEEIYGSDTPHSAPYADAVFSFSPEEATRLMERFRADEEFSRRMLIFYGDNRVINRRRSQLIYATRKAGVEEPRELTSDIIFDHYTLDSMRLFTFRHQTNRFERVADWLWGNERDWPLKPEDGSRIIYTEGATGERIVTGFNGANAGFVKSWNQRFMPTVPNKLMEIYPQLFNQGV